MVTLRMRITETFVGLFMIAGLIALAVLAFKVSGLADLGHGSSYVVTAEFDNIGGLKVRAPVSVSGVRVGRVSSITIDNNNFRARVVLQIDKNINTLPIDTSASILSQGILGANYISLAPGFEEGNLKGGDRIETTHSALILENLIGQLIYSLKPDTGKPAATTAKAQPASATSNSTSGEKGDH